MTLLSWLYIASAMGQLITPFQARYSDNISGNMTLIGNQLMTCPASAANCAAAQAGTANPIGNNNNNAYVMQFVDVDVNPSTFNSSRAGLNLPVGADVQFAGLYWGADLSAGTSGQAAINAAAANQVLLRAPDANNYITVAGTILGNATGTGNDYAAFSNITALVKASGNGDYTVANVQAGTGNDRDAGWTMVVVYQAAGEPSRNIKVYDGFAAVFSSTPAVNIPISGFVTPQNGAVTTQVGVIAFEGDLGLTGDTLRLNNVLLSDNFHPSSNAFTSSISLNNARYNNKTPNYANTQGFDASILSANGILANGANNATINLTTSNDAYYPAVVAFSTNLFAPNVSAIKSVVDVNGGQVLPGDVLRYTVSVTNNGGDGANNLILNDTIPANTSYVNNSLSILSGANSGAKTDAVNDDQAEFVTGLNNAVRFRLGTGANTSNGGNLAPNASTSIQFEVTVNNDVLNQTTISNQADISFTAATLGTPLTAVSNSADVLAVRPILSLNKSATPNPVNAGDLITYTIQFANNGGAPALNSVISDAIPANTTFFSASAGGVLGGNTVTWNLGQINPGNSGSVILVVRVDTPLTNNTVISNTAILSADTLADVNSSADVTVTSDPVLQVSKVASADFVAAGDFITYTIAFSNIGNDTALNFSLVDDLPNNATFVSASANGLLVGNQVLWNLGNLTAGAMGSVSLTVQIDSPIADGTVIINTVTADADNAAAVESSVLVTAVSSPLLTIDKTDLPDPVEAGSQLTYQINFSNVGTDTATSVAVVDDLPVEVTFIAATGGATYDPVTHEVTLLLDTLLAGGSGSFQISVLVNEPLADGFQITNLARIRSAELDFVEVNEITTVNSAPVISLNKIANPEPVAAGATLSYTIEYSNTGNNDASGVIIRDFLPDFVTFIAASNGGVFDGTDTITWNIGNLTIGSSGQLTVVVAVDSPLPDGTRLVNNVSLLSNELPPLTDTVVSTVTSAPVLSIIKTAASETVNAGAQLVYSIEIYNAGNATATNVLISDLLPNYVTFVNASSNGLFNGNNQVSWLIGDLTPGQSASVSMTVLVDTPLANGTLLVNTAEVSSDQTLPINDQTITVVISGPLLNIEKTGPLNAVAGEQITYSISVTNFGNDTATGVTITDALPPFTTFISANQSGVYDAYAQTVSWQLGALNAQATVTVELTVQIDAVIDNQTTLINTATVQSNELPPVGDDTTTVVNSAPILTLSKVVDLTSVGAGGTLVYTLEVSNIGNANATNVVLTDILPQQTTFVGQTGGGVNQGNGQVVWNLGNLAVGNSISVTLTVVVDAIISNNTTLLNQANVTADGVQPIVATASSQVNSAAVLSITKISSEDVVSPGEVFTFTLSINNSGTDTANNVTVVDTLPAGLDFSAASNGGVFDTIDTITWLLGDLLAGETIDLTLTVSVSATTDGLRLTNVAEMSSDQTPPVSDSADVVISNPDLSTTLQVSKTTNTPNPTIGQYLDFVIDYQVLGPADAMNAQLVDTLPAGLTFVAASDGGQFNGSQVIWTLGNLSNGSSGNVLLTVQVGTDQAGQNLTNVVDFLAENAPSVQAQQAVDVVPIVMAADISLSKVIDSGQNYSQVGEVIEYLFIVTNTGNVSLTGPMVINDDITSNETCPDLSSIGNGDANFDPAESITCFASYVVVATDISNGQVVNTASASIDNVNSNLSSATATSVAAPNSISLDKTINSGQTYSQIGDVITYLFTVTNTGNASLLGPMVINDDLTSNETCPALSGIGNGDNNFDPTETITCTASYVVTPADLLNNQVNNTATASIDNINSNPSSATATRLDAPSGISLSKVIDSGQTYSQVGDVINYLFIVTNTGNVSLAGPMVINDDITSNESCPDIANVGNGDANLDPTESITCTANYAVTAVDLLNGQVVNTASASIDNVDSNLSSATATGVTVGNNISLSKVIGSGQTYSQVGDVIDYLFIVTNTGNTSLLGPVVINDDLTNNESCPDLSSSGNGDNNFDPAETITCTASYTVTAADINNQDVFNTANASIDGIVSNNSSATATFVGIVLPAVVPVPALNTLTWLLMCLLFSASGMYWYTRQN